MNMNQILIITVAMLAIVVTSAQHHRPHHLIREGRFGGGLMPNPFITEFGQSGGFWGGNGMLGGPLLPFGSDWNQQVLWGPQGAQSWAGQTGWTNNGLNHNTLHHNGLSQSNINDPWFAYRQFSSGLGGSGTLGQTFPGVNGIGSMVQGTGVVGAGGLSLPGGVNTLGQNSRWNSFAPQNGGNGNFPLIPGTNGLTQGFSGTNGLTQGFSGTNGLTQGFSGTNGLTQGFSGTNGLTQGFTNTQGFPAGQQSGFNNFNGQPNFNNGFNNPGFNGGK